ncbi:hypothetical protein V1224_14455 [Lachnospiraceae bacterium JLR.KK008]
MRKRFLSLAMIFVLPFAVAACGNYNIADENAPPQNVEEDPFAGAQEDGDLGFLSHGEASPARADDQSVLPYEYNGGEFVLDYQFSSEGKLDSIGFPLFLDGKPQAYKVNDTGRNTSISTASGHQKSMKRNFLLCSHRTQGKRAIP